MACEKAVLCGHNVGGQWTYIPCLLPERSTVTGEPYHCDVTAAEHGDSLKDCKKLHHEFTPAEQVGDFSGAAPV